MDPSALVERALAESAAARDAFFAGPGRAALLAAAEDVARALEQGGKLLLFGNGGSAADAQHIATEFVNKMEAERRALAAVALTTDTSALTAIGNDAAFAQVFARQVEALARPGDVVLAISTSGDSGNVVAGLEAAAALGLVTIGLLGRDGGRCRALCRHALVVPGRSTPRIQETHILIGHLLAALVEERLAGA